MANSSILAAIKGLAENQMAKTESHPTSVFLHLEPATPVCLGLEKTKRSQIWLNFRPSNG
jgi:hypothetical protein